jgi:ATP-dependent exoDNAse (exonuclease V) alpha subunit
MPKYKLEIKERRVFKSDSFKYLRTATYNYKNKQWTKLAEKTTAKDLINLGKSFRIEGLGGTGKTYLIKQIQKELSEQKKKFVILAPTNKACRVMQTEHAKAKTLYSFITRFEKRRSELEKLEVEYIIIDEINLKRKEINDQQMKAFLTKKKVAITKAFKLEERKQDPNSQDVYLYKDMPIISKSNNKHYNLANNDTFYIQKIAKSIEDGLQYIHICPEIGANTSQPILTTDFQRLFRVAFAMTVHSSQGSTFDFPYTLHEWNKYTNEMKYVGLSRTTKKEYITIK